MANRSEAALRAASDLELLVSWLVVADFVFAHLVHVAHAVGTCALFELRGSQASVLFQLT